MLVSPIAMRKTDKKTDNNIRQLLTQVCDYALKDIEGFVWLTHQVNYTRFPESLKVVCVFETHTALERFQATKQSEALNNMIITKLVSANITLKKPAQSIIYDTQQLCDEQHHGNWALRLSQIVSH